MLFLVQKGLETKQEFAPVSIKARATHSGSFRRTSTTMQGTTPSTIVVDSRSGEVAASNAATGAQSRACFLNYLRVGSC